MGAILLKLWEPRAGEAHKRIFLITMEDDEFGFKESEGSEIEEGADAVLGALGDDEKGEYNPPVEIEEEDL